MTGRSRTTAPPAIFGILVLPYGVSSGFVSVTLPFILVRHGFSVGSAAAVTAIGLSANIWRFLWAPLIDLTLSLHKWYLIGLTLCSASILSFCFIPVTRSFEGLLTAMVLISQVAACFVVGPVGGFMGKTVDEDKKGRAGGWYQAGNLGGMGMGGGAGVWLASHYSFGTAGAVLAVSMLFCALALFYVPLIPTKKGETMAAGFRRMLIDLKTLFRSPIALFTTIIVMAPIGIGAGAYLWSSVGSDWKVTADTVAFVTGGLSGLVSAAGCVFGGWIADKSGRWWAFFGSGTLIAVVALFMRVAGFTPFTYITGVLTYAFMFGFATAAFSAIVLLAMGQGLASTKYALLSSLSNIPVVYMTAFDGWLYDKYGIRTMLLGEALLGLVFILLFLIVLSRVPPDRPQPVLSE